MNDFSPRVEGVAEGLGDVAGRTLDFILLADVAVEFFGDGEAATASDQFATGGRGRGW